MPVRGSPVYSMAKRGRTIMKILVIGAHPEDATCVAGGTAKLYAEAGHEVKFISMTTGDTAHPKLRGSELVEQRRRELWEACSRGGFEHQILNHHDGRLYPNQAIVEEMIGLIRSANPDLVLTHRPHVFQPDQRHTSLIVQDAVSMLTIPSISPRVAAPRRKPVVVYVEDSVSKPIPFEPDVAVSIDKTIDAKIEMLDCHPSQVYEWLPYVQGDEFEVPSQREKRKQWLTLRVREEAAATADRYRLILRVLYGMEQGSAIRYAEAFEATEYGEPLTVDNRQDIFPFA